MVRSTCLDSLFESFPFTLFFFSIIFAVRLNRRPPIIPQPPAKASPKTLDCRHVPDQFFREKNVPTRLALSPLNKKNPWGPSPPLPPPPPGGWPDIDLHEIFQAKVDRHNHELFLMDQSDSPNLADLRESVVEHVTHPPRAGRPSRLAPAARPALTAVVRSSSSAPLHASGHRSSSPSQTPSRSPSPSRGRSRSPPRHPALAHAGLTAMGSVQLGSPHYKRFAEAGQAIVGGGMVRGASVRDLIH
jgi:hypothetical protein